MTNAYKSRKDARAAISALIASKMPTEFEEIYTQFPLTFEKQSPVCVISSFDAMPHDLTAGVRDQSIRLVVGVWVLRTYMESDADPGTDGSEERIVLIPGTEDIIDDLTAKIMAVLVDYDKTDFFQRSQMAFEIVDGDQYRFETHFIEIEAFGENQASG